MLPFHLAKQGGFSCGTADSTFKSFTSFLLAWTYFLLSISGIVLFISPFGRVANWTKWTLMGETKQGWQAIHVLMGVIFITGGIFHLLKFNSKIFLHYITARRPGLRHRREMVASLLLLGIVLGGTSAGLAPFTSFMEAGEKVKNSWESDAEKAPMPHTELLSLRQLAALIQIEPMQAVGVLKQAGLNLEDPEQT